MKDKKEKMMNEERRKHQKMMRNSGERQRIDDSLYARKGRNKGRKKKTPK